jgi:hypothetical protein
MKEKLTLDDYCIAALCVVYVALLSVFGLVALFVIGSLIIIGGAHLFG